GPPPILLSFPTRRSSDLAIQEPAMLTERDQDTLKAAQAQVNRLVLGKAAEVRLAFVALLSDGHLLIEDLPGLGKTTLAHALAARSEEHTSELQSRENLVC